jgi:hypothetical protein
LAERPPGPEIKQGTAHGRKVEPCRMRDNTADNCKQHQNVSEHWNLKVQKLETLQQNSDEFMLLHSEHRRRMGQAKPVCPINQALSGFVPRTNG